MGQYAFASKKGWPSMDTPTNVDRSAPVFADHGIDVNTPRDAAWRLHTDINAWPSWQNDIESAVLEQPLAVGTSFSWSTYGMALTSTVYAINANSRILWGGTANGITAIHEWTFTDTPNGVHVTTTESFAGDAVSADASNMQALLDQSLLSWLQQLKAAAEGN
jgi:hypothetical protein